MTAPTGLLVLGGGGFGREVLDVVERPSPGCDPPASVVVVDPFASAENRERLRRRGYRLIADPDDLGDPVDRRRWRHVVGVGDPALRQWLASREVTGPATPLVHETARLGAGVELGAGTVVCALAHLGGLVTAGVHVHLNPRAVVGPGAWLGDHVSVNPAALVGAGAQVGPGCLLGARSVLAPGVVVGAGSVVGAAAVVVEDVPAGSVVVGSPALRRGRTG